MAAATSSQFAHEKNLVTCALPFELHLHPAAVNDAAHLQTSESVNSENDERNDSVLLHCCYAA